MKKWLAFSTASALFIAACTGGGSGTATTGSSTPPSSAASSATCTGAAALVKIAAIQEDRPQNEPWAAGLHDSLVKLQTQDNCVQFTETQDAFTPTKAEPEIRQFISAGYQMILGHSFAMSDTIHKLAVEFPKVFFEVSNFEPPVPPNLTVATESYLEVSYATCWLLASISKSHTIGIIAAQPLPNQKDDIIGCQLGAKAADPTGKVLSVFDGSFTDLQAAREQSQNLVNQGADGLFGSSSAEDSLGVMAYCEQNQQLNCSTWSADGRQYGPNTSVTSILLDWTPVLKDWVAQVRSGSFKVSTADLTFANGGLSPQPFAGPSAAKVPASVQAGYLSVIQQLTAGTISLPASLAHPNNP
jgi:basic membrane lipoprotein Med (substrate-binding protein (PBP1-ABC) superfamily)